MKLRQNFNNISRNSESALEDPSYVRVKIDKNEKKQWICILPVRFASNFPKCATAVSNCNLCFVLLLKLLCCHQCYNNYFKLPFSAVCDYRSRERERERENECVYVCVGGGANEHVIESVTRGQNHCSN